MKILWPHETIEDELLSAISYDGWLVETFGVENLDDYECIQEAILMEFYNEHWK